MKKTILKIAAKLLYKCKMLTYNDYQNALISIDIYTNKNVKVEPPPILSMEKGKVYLVDKNKKKLLYEIE